MVRLAGYAFVVALVLFPSIGHAQWQPDGVPVSVALSDQSAPMAVSDGAGGAILAWMDYRNNFVSDIYAQRVNAAGVALWTANGVAVCTATDQQYYPQLVTDGAGGAIVIWEDYRAGATTDVYAQRINSSGVVQWAANGVAVCLAANPQFGINLVSDGAGGAIASWYDFRTSLTNSEIYVQRINGAGTPQWTNNGVALTNVTDNQTNPAIVADGSGGAIVAWRDARAGNTDVYAQRVNASGVAQWAANGVVVCNDPSGQDGIIMTSDGSGGAIAAWYDSRYGTIDVFAQKVNGSGVAQWASNGVGLCYAAANQYPGSITTNGAGGAIVVWADGRGASNDIYGQRVNANGIALWTYDGVALCTATGDQYNPKLLSDGSGGAVVVWTDDRNVYSDVYTQKVNSAGVTQWANNGVAVCTAASYELASTFVSDGAGGGIVGWSDGRSANYDVYAQRIEFQEGYWGHPEPAVTLVADVKGDQGGKVKVNWKASGLDVRNYDTITHYSIWRATDIVAAAAAVQANPSLVVDPSRITLGFEGPAYRVERTPTTSYYWELVGTQSAQFFDGYRFSANTTADSTSQGTANNYFQVLSHTADEYTFWVSNVLSGHSVDNLAPAAPLSLTAQRIGNYVYLKWNHAVAPDLRDYAVYRKTSSGVTPVPVNFLASAEDTVLTDTTPPASALYYIVTAYDVHANQSAPSNQASVQAPTGVGNTPAITQLTVLQNHPNPFQGTTDLQVGLPAASDVTLEVYDVAGRRVVTQALGRQSAGWKSVAFAGRDDAGRALASGVYFYKITANGTTVTNKMVIAR